MIGIILLAIPLAFLVTGIIYFSVTLRKLKKPMQELSSQGMTVIPPKVEVAFSPKIRFLGKEIITLNTQVLSDEDVEFLCYAIYMKSHDKVVETHNIEMHLERKKVVTQEWPFLKMPPTVANEVTMARPIRNLINKEELLWAQN